jgi:hypothetical protein
MLDSLIREDKGDKIGFSFVIGKDILNQIYLDINISKKSYILQSILKGIENSIIREVRKDGENKEA